LTVNNIYFIFKSVSHH